MDTVKQLVQAEAAAWLVWRDLYRAGQEGTLAERVAWQKYTEAAHAVAAYTDATASK